VIGGRLDRGRGGRLGRHEGTEVTPHRAGVGALERRARAGAGQIYGDVSSDHGVRCAPRARASTPRGRRRGRGCASSTGRADRMRPRGGRHRRPPPHRAGGAGRAPIDNASWWTPTSEQRAGHLRGRRTWPTLAPLYERNVRVEHWANAANQARRQPATCSGRGEALRADPLLFLRPVRRRHGVSGLAESGDRSSSAGTGRPRVHRVWLTGRSRRAGNERERLGRYRSIQALVRRDAGRPRRLATPTSLPSSSFRPRAEATPGRRFMPRTIDR